MKIKRLKPTPPENDDEDDDAPAAPELSGPLAERAAELGVALTAECLAALEGLPLEDAVTILEDTASRGAAIKNPSRYMMGAVARYAEAEGDKVRGAGELGEN